jgi:hypothetical protein
MVTSGIRKELGDQGTNEYLQSDIKDETYIDHPLGSIHTQREKSMATKQYTVDP